MRADLEKIRPLLASTTETQKFLDKNSSLFAE
jgi:hypothetical protein